MKNRKLNILFLTTHLNTGGITSYLYTLSQGLLKNGHCVYIGSSGGERVEDFKRLGVEWISLNIRTKSELNPNLYLALPNLKKIFQDKRIDVIHAQTRITQVQGTLLSQMTGKPLITTCHGYFKPKFFRQLFPCWGEKVIAISEQVKEHLENDFHVLPERIALIPNGVVIDDFRISVTPNKKELKAKFGLHDGVVIGIIARLSDVKGHEVLIRAMKNIFHAQLMIVGEGKMESELKALVTKLGLESQIRFYPIINRTKEVLSVMDIFVMPSLQEGLGLSVMEAQAAGLPVVASKVGGLMTLIEHEKTGLHVEAKDEHGLARAINRLIEDPALAKRLAQAGQDNIVRNFSSEIMTEKTQSVYENLLI